MSYQPKHPDERYLSLQPFDDRDVEKACMQSKIVKTRKEHTCCGLDTDQHQIPRGSKALYEKGLIDGEWGSFYLCLECFDRFLEISYMSDIHPKSLIYETLS